MCDNVFMFYENILMMAEEKCKTISTIYRIEYAGERSR